MNAPRMPTTTLSRQPCCASVRITMLASQPRMPPTMSHMNSPSCIASLQNRIGVCLPCGGANFQCLFGSGGCGAAERLVANGERLRFIGGGELEQPLHIVAVPGQLREAVQLGLAEQAAAFGGHGRLRHRVTAP